MSRVNLTKGQAEDLADILETTEKKAVLEAAADKCTHFDFHPSLNSLGLEELAIALYVGYDIVKTEEEKLIYKYKELNRNRSKAHNRGDLATVSRCKHDMRLIKDTLNSVNIKLKGINA
ncbi:hypothetical protein [Bacillus sp. Marseille-P3800]|uniref:hypothetical protein n=1 Tax=Bacillus sp. Marseille-P3800 TaxID=2014782 RepID=UPI000C07D37F|nr:hypothetical protein [Bacillus sp. Marseille-P3800]